MNDAQSISATQAISVTEFISVTQAIVKRRSIKAFDPHHRMTEQEIAKLMSLAMLSQIGRASCRERV